MISDAFTFMIQFLLYLVFFNFPMAMANGGMVYFALSSTLAGLGGGIYFFGRNVVWKSDLKESLENITNNLSYIREEIKEVKQDIRDIKNDFRYTLRNNHAT